MRTRIEKSLQNSSTSARYGPPKGRRLWAPFCVGFYVFCLFLSGCQKPAPNLPGEERRAPKTGKWVTIQAVGDLSPTAKANRLFDELGYDYAYNGTRHELAKGHINFANLEAPITLRGEAYPKRYNFRIRPEAMKAVAKAKLNMVSLANNHMLDYGEMGLSDTLRYLAELKIHHAGAGKNLSEARKPAILVKNGVRVGFLAYSLTFPKAFYAESDKPGTAFGHEHHIQEDVTALRPMVEVLVVSFHWGKEKSHTPKDYQIHLAHVAIDHGANLVLGHHPHVVQGTEYYKNGLIFYSLGNYVFGSYSNNVQWGMLARTSWWVEKAGSPAVLLGAQVIPLDINNFRVEINPVPLADTEAQQAIQDLNKYSEDFKTKWIYRNKKAYLKIPPRG